MSTQPSHKRKKTLTKSVQQSQVRRQGNEDDDNIESHPKKKRNIVYSPTVFISNNNIIMDLRDIDTPGAATNTVNLNNLLRPINNSFGLCHEGGNEDTEHDDREVKVYATIAYYKNQPVIGHVNTYRCLIEDFACVTKGECLLILIPKVRKLSSEWSGVVASQSSKVVTINRNPFYMVVGKVHSNPSFTTLSTPNTILQLKEEIFTGNTGVNVSFKSLPDLKPMPILLKSVLMGKRCGLQIWKCGTYMRDVYDALANRNKDSSQAQAFHNLYDEMYGDKSQCLSLCLAYYRLQLKYAKQQQLTKEKTPSAVLSGESFERVVKQIDEAFTDTIKKCFSSFSAINEALLPHNELVKLVELYKDQLSGHHQTMNTIMNIGKKIGITRNKHLVDSLFYDKIAFYQFLSQVRTMNPHLLTGWAITSTISSYARGITHNRQSILTYFGAAVHDKTMNKFLENIKNENSNAIPLLLSNKKILMATMDNNQKGYGVKNPRGGINNKFVCVTGRTFVECVETELGNVEDCHVHISYSNQKIPSVLHQPHFETIMNDGDISHGICVDVIKDFKNVNNTGMPVDITGNRVQAYLDLVDICHTICNEKRYMSGYNFTKDQFKTWNHQPRQFAESYIRKSTMKKIAKIKGSFIPLAASFQRRHTMIWNPKCGKAAKLLIPVVSSYNEMKLDEYGMAVIELMTMAGLLTKKCNKQSNGKEKPEWYLTDNYMDKTLYLCMDGLSLDRHRSLQKKLVDTPLSFTKSFEQSIRFQKALSRIIETPGPLHIAFHMCQCIYTIYTPFLGVMKSILKWKKMKFTKVNESFRHCKALLTICLGEAERLAWDMFLSDNSDSVAEHIEDTNLSDEMFSVWLAKEYQKYLTNVLRTSSDKRRKYLFSLIRSTKLFLAYWKSVRCGDRIYQEYAVMKFLGVYMRLKKPQYIEIVLSTIEREYHDISFKELNELRVNSHIQYKDDDDDILFRLCVALDEMQENINKWTKELCISGTIESWLKHSPNVMVGRKSLAFTDGEYKRHSFFYDDMISEKQKMERRSYSTHGVTPRMLNERSIVYEFMVFFLEEKENRKFNIKEAWDTSKKLTTELSYTADDDNTLHDDRMDDLFSVLGLHTEKEVDAEDGDIIDATLTNSAEIIPAHEDVDLAESEPEVASTTSLEGIHKLGLCDIFEEGDKLVEKKKFNIIRKRRHQRTQRFSNFLRSAYERALNRAHLQNFVSPKSPETNYLPLPSFFGTNSNKSESELNDIINNNMQKIWNRKPKDFQLSVIKRILRMHSEVGQKTPTLLVKGTGGGKSAVMQTLATILRGVTIVIENTLSLSADQLSKIDSASQVHGLIKGVHLDSLKTDKERGLLRRFIQDRKNTSSLIIFTSPDALCHERWSRMIEEMIKSNTIRLICVDEVHQFVSFGLSFCYKFKQVKDVLFNKVIHSKETKTEKAVLKVPVLFMTATFNQELLLNLRKLTGLSVYDPTHAWSPVEDFKKRNIDLHLVTTPQYIKVLKEQLTRTLKEDWRRKAVVYTNTVSDVRKIKTNLDKWLDETSEFMGDVMVLHGDQESELKEVNINTFAHKLGNEHEVKQDVYYPRILVATSACIGAGLDCDDVFIVYRVGFPTSIHDLMQEMGRCGRKLRGNGGNSDHYIISVSLKDFLYVLGRIYSNQDRKDSLLTIKAQETLERKRLFEVLQFLFLSNKCWHSELERQSVLGNNECHNEKCTSSCPVCTGTISSSLLPISFDGMRSFLGHALIKSAQGKKTPEELCADIANYDNYANVIYNEKNKKKVCGYHIQGTVLQLVACGLVEMHVEKETDKDDCDKISCRVYCCLAVKDDGFTPLFLDKSNWTGINLLGPATMDE